MATSFVWTDVTYNQASDVTAINALGNAVEDMHGAWPTYVPVWTSTGTAPALGNGTITGSYLQVGKTMTARGRLRIGSTTTLGTGGWFVSVPVAASANSQSHSVGAVWILRSGNTGNCGSCSFWSSTQLWLSAPGIDITATSPYSWAVNDEIHWQMKYETT